ncbi:Ltp family lipoprotein [Bifidobacterium asteroides]
MQPPEEKPIYKKVWFWVVIAVVAILVFAATAGSNIKLTIGVPKIETAGISQQLNKMKKTPKDTETPANPNPDDHQAALAKAQDYSEVLHKSKQGIYEQLTNEDKFTPEAAQYAIDHLKADDKANALAAAQDDERILHLSKQRVYDNLTRDEKYTPEDAQYAVDNLKADYKANALAAAKYFQKIHMSPAEIQKQLTSQYGEKFTPEEAAYAMQHLKQ